MFSDAVLGFFPVKRPCKKLPQRLVGSYGIKGPVKRYKKDMGNEEEIFPLKNRQKAEIYAQKISKQQIEDGKIQHLGREDRVHDLCLC